MTDGADNSPEKMINWDNWSREDYLRLALRTWDADNYGGGDRAATYLLLGLANEVGELIGKWKKWLRGDYISTNEGHAKLREDLIAELGDVRWYQQVLMYELDITEEEVEKANNQKTIDRINRGTLFGSGDNR